MKKSTTKKNDFVKFILTKKKEFFKFNNKPAPKLVLFSNLIGYIVLPNDGLLIKFRYVWLAVWNSTRMVLSEANSTIVGSSSDTLRSLTMILSCNFKSNSWLVSRESSLTNRSATWAESIDSEEPAASLGTILFELVEKRFNNKGKRVKRLRQTQFIRLFENGAFEKNQKKISEWFDF